MARGGGRSFSARPSRGRGGRGGRGGGSSRGGARGGFRGGRSRPHRGGFRASRLQETEDASDSGSVTYSAESEPEQESAASDDQQSGSEEDETSTRQSYASLLQALRTKSNDDEPARKKRKLSIEASNAEQAVEQASSEETLEEEVANAKEDADLEEAVEDDAEVNERGDLDSVDSEDEAALMVDPFEKHVSGMTEKELHSVLSTIKQKKPQTRIASTSDDLKKTIVEYDGINNNIMVVKSAGDLLLKQKLAVVGSKTFSTCNKEERDLTTEIFNYRDILYNNRTVSNAHTLRQLSCLHSLNHIFKTRDRVLKNNAKLAHDDSGMSDYRDQGFSRPKVLVIVPTKQACVRFLETIVELCEPDQQENKARFLDTFSREDDEPWHEKPEDFREIFGGNHEEDFRVGLKFTRKTIKYFSGFYNSDIIFASALGLMRTVTTGGGGSKDKKKGHDADFLSSIEVVIVDHANAIQMQNWQHVEYSFSQLNLLPKESHGCDFSRVRHWYLDGNAKYFRQTIIFANYLTPEINSLANTYLHNLSGRAKYVRTYTGAMLELPASLPMTITQTFLRFDSPSPMTDHDTRFKHFTTTILPSLLRDKHGSKGNLLYVPSYFDFVRLRNHFSTSAETTNLSFGTLSEYTEVRDVARTRSHFSSGRYHVLLYSERAHHHFRYRLRGVKKIVFYGLPDNPVFWTEIVALLGIAGSEKTDQDVGAGQKQGKGLVRAIFSKWDVLKLERIVGTERVGRLLAEKGGDTFDFV